MKVCIKCGRALPLEEFSRNYKMRGGRRNDCKACAAVYHAEWRSRIPAHHLTIRGHGLTPDGYASLLAAQGGGCAICGAQPSEAGSVLVIDHDHRCCPGKRSCGKCVRGLLCNACNRGIGFLQDSADVLSRAAAYLSGDQR